MVCFLVSGILITDHITFESKMDLHKRKYKWTHSIFLQGHKACHYSQALPFTALGNNKILKGVFSLTLECIRKLGSHAKTKNYVSEM